MHRIIRIKAYEAEHGPHFNDEHARKAVNKIDSLRQENTQLALAASQQAQTANIVSQLKAPCPTPAYVVPNPNCCYGGFAGYGYGYNEGCGC